MKKKALIGAFLALIVVCSVAARYEDLSIGWLRVARIKGASLSTDIIYVDNAVTFASNVILSAGFTGDWTGDDLTANGSATATLDINMPSALGTNTITTKLGVVRDTSGTYLDEIISGTNDSAETISYLKRRLTVTDYTTNTEDVTVVYTVPVGGADTVVLTLGGTAEVTASKLTVSGALTADTTIDGDSITVDAGAGIDCQAAGALKVGVATATSVDVGVAGAMTTVKGTLNVDQAVTLDTTLGVVGTLSSSNQTVNGVITGIGGATIDNTADTAVLNLTETTVKVTGAFNATGAADLDSTLNVDSTASLIGGVTLGSTLVVTGVVTTIADVDMTATGGTTSDGDLTVAGYSKFSGVVELDGVVQVDGVQTNTAAVQMNSTLGVSGLASLTTVAGTGLVDLDGILKVDGVQSNSAAVVLASTFTIGAGPMYFNGSTGMTWVATNVVFAGGASTSNWTFVNGALVHNGL